MALSGHTKKSNIVYLVSEGGTKLCRALLLKKVEVLRPADINQNWSMDKFLETHKMKILPKLNASSKHIVFPSLTSETNLEKWDVCVFCCVLKEACELGPELRMFLDHLKKIRNKFFHWSVSPIDDNKYDDTIKKLKVIFDKILDELNDGDFRSKINDIFSKVEAGEIPDDELSRILEAIEKTSDEIKDQVKHAHDDTRNFVSDQHLETRNVIIKGNKGMEEKLNTFIEFVTSKFIEQSSKINENAPEAVGIEIGVRNFGNTEMEKSFTMMMVQLFNDEIRKVPDLSNLPSNCQLKLREIIHKICKSFEEKGYIIQNATQKCILLEIQCTSILAFMTLYRDYIDGSLDAYFSELQTAVRSMDCFKDVCLETIMYEDDFLRTISKIDFHKILPTQTYLRNFDFGVKKSNHDECGCGALDEQSENGESNKIFLQVIPKAHVEPHELERIIVTETQDLAESYGLSFHTRIFIGNLEADTRERIKTKTQFSQVDNILPEKENERTDVKQLNYDEVMSQSSPTNCTVYCGGIINGLTEEVIKKTFSSYGTIQEIRVFKDKGYAFIRFSNKESAGQAICGVHGQMVSEQQVKCSWGKESNDAQQSQSSTPQMMGSQSPPQQYNGNGMGGNMGGYGNYSMGGYGGYYPGYGGGQQGYNMQGGGQGYGGGYGYQYGSMPMQGQWGMQMGPGQPAPAYGQGGYQMGFQAQ